jgi:hypothetical protein
LVEKKQIIKTWRSGNNSINLCLPITLTRQFKLDDPSYVVVEGKPDLRGILVRKLEAGDIK